MINVLNASHPLPSVVVAGHGCLDILPEMGENLAGNFREIFKPGRLLEVGSVRMFTGGSALNTGLALHRLGIPVRIICKTGAAVGACNVESPDAIGGLLSWEKTVQRIESGWQRLPLVLDDSAWYEENALHLWKKMPAVPKQIP